MRHEKISEAMNQLNIDFIQETLTYKPLENSQKPRISKGQQWQHFWQFHRIAASICLLLLTITFSFTTAFAASESFRQTVISIFYPLYSDGEIKELQDGHRTASFDERDVLLTFLDRFNAEKMEMGISVKYQNGYSYQFVSSNEQSEEAINGILAIVESNKPGYRLLIKMEKKPYEETTGIWQIISYQVITKLKAEEILKEMPAYVPVD